MKDARIDRSRTGEAAGDETPVPELDHTVDTEGRSDVAKRDWTRRTPGPEPDTSLLVHWVDDKGSVVRLISSHHADGDRRGA